jgi:hypothetical protein
VQEEARFVDWGKAMGSWVRKGEEMLGLGMGTERGRVRGRREDVGRVGFRKGLPSS